MAVESYSNTATTTLSAAITDTSGTSIIVTSATGFPSSGQYRIKIDSELFIVTAGQGTTTWTVTRGAESSIAATHSNAAAVTHVVTAASLRRIAEGIAVVASADASYDYSAATGLWLPKAAAFAPSSEAGIGFDTTQRTLKVRDATFGNASVSRVLSAQYANADTLSAATISTTETAFATNLTIPANYFILSKCIRVTASYQWTSSSTPATIVLKLRLGGVGGTVMFSTFASTPVVGQTNRSTGLTWTLMGTAAAGASVAVDCGFQQSYFGGSAWGPNQTAQPVTLATNASQVLALTVTYSAATAGNTISLRQLIVEELN